MVESSILFRNLSAKIQTFIGALWEQISTISITCFKMNQGAGSHLQSYNSCIAIKRTTLGMESLWNRLECSNRLLQVLNSPTQTSCRSHNGSEDLLSAMNAEDWGAEKQTISVTILE